MAKTEYPLVPLNLIEIAPRPIPGQEQDPLFFNPRNEDSFTSEEMCELRESIREDGLQQPPIVRIFTSDGTMKGDIDKIELVAGERRLRCCQKLVEENPKCIDRQGKEIPAKDFLSQIPCKVYFNLPDDKALRIAFIENKKHRSLTVKEEIALVERLLARGLRQEEIAKLLRSNATWVSQTSSFRVALPSEAFKDLLGGDLTRHLAVKLLSFRPEDRDATYQHGAEVRDERYEAEDITLRDTIANLEDTKDLADSQRKCALKDGDDAEAQRHDRQAQRLGNELDATKKKRTKLKKGRRRMKQSDLLEGSRRAGTKPRKAQMLTKEAVEQFYRDLPQVWLTKGHKDPVCKQEALPDVLMTIRETAVAILAGETDPNMVVRSVMVRRGHWKLPASYKETSSEPVLSR